MKKYSWIILAGAIVGIISVILVEFGNPGNMGFCNACFIRDITGALGLQRTETVQYMRPEIIGLVLGAFVIALIKKEYAPRGGSAPISRFIISFFIMVGALMFLGCPLRMVIRIGGGDLNAVIALVGFVVGIGGGSILLNKGFSFKRNYALNKSEGVLLPVINGVMLFVLVAIPSVLFFSTKGPGSMHAPVAIALCAGLIVGMIAYKTRFCMVAGIRDSFLFKDFYMLYGFIAMLVAVVIGNLITGNFHMGFLDQPIAHTDGLWNFLGMTLVGLGSVLLGGCPLRQLILAGSGNTDSVVSVFGMIAGAAFCHNFGWASSAAGPTDPGKIVTMIGFVVMLGIAFINIKKKA